jgi:hypothetical protein
MEIQSEYAEIVVSAGADSMSRVEFYIPGEHLKWGIGGKTDPKWGFFPRQHGSMDLWGIPFYDRIQRGRPMHQPIEGGYTMIKEITAQELNTEHFINEKVKEIKGTVGDGMAINALSGGVDSSTVTMLGHRDGP